MAHMRKCDMSEAVHLCKHYERNSNIKSYSNSEVDMNRSGENYNLAPERESPTEYIRHQLDEIQHANRKDLVVMADLIITAPEDLPREYLTEFFQASYDFCVGRYGTVSGLGEDVAISSYVHMDETTPHMHFAFLPVKAERDKISGEIVRQRFCCKEVVCRKDLKTLHSDLQQWLDDRNIPAKVLNSKTKYDSNGRALSVKELKRKTYLERERDKRRELSGNRWVDSEETEREIKIGRW